MHRSAFSWLTLSLLVLPLLAGLSTAQVQDETDCAPGPTNDPNTWDHQTGGGTEDTSVCQEDAGSPKDDVPPTQVPATKFNFTGINNFTWAWSHAHDPINEDVDDDDGFGSHPNPEPENYNGVVANYIVYNHTKSFTDVADAFASQSVTPAASPGNYSNTIDFAGLSAGDEVYLAVTAVDDHGNEGPAAFASITMSGAGIILGQSSGTLKEADEEFVYTVGVNDFIQAKKAVVIDIEIIQGLPIMGEDPITTDKERVQLTRDAPTAEVTIIVTDDELGSGDRNAILRHTVDAATVGRDTRFNNAPAADLELLVIEDEPEPSIELVGNLDLTIREGDDDLTFQVKLSREPTDDVFLIVESSNENRMVVASPLYVQFGRFDWDTYQDVTLHAVDNDIIDGARPVTISISIDPEDTATEYIERASNRQVIVLVQDNEDDDDRDSILDSEDNDPNDRYDVEFRPTDFRHQLSVQGTSVRFSWTAHHLDERISHYILWEFSDPTNAAQLEVIPQHRFYNHTVVFDAESVHTFALQPVLVGDDQDRHGNYAYDEEAAVQLGRLVFDHAYFEEVCGVTGYDDDGFPNMTEDDTDGDGICDDFEDIIGTDPDDADTDGDGRTDYEEVFEDNTIPNDTQSSSGFLPAWARNVWVIVGTVLLLGSLVVAIVSFARRGGRDGLE